MKCRFEQPFATFGIYLLYLKKVDKINISAVTTLTIEQEKGTFCRHNPAKIYQEI